MFTQHHKNMTTLATTALMTLAAFTAAVRADFAPDGGNGNTGPYVNDDNVLVFDGDDAIDDYVRNAVRTASLADLLNNEDNEQDVIDIALDVAGDDMGFGSLADDIIAYQNGALSVSELNVDAFTVTDWTQQRLLNSELEIQIGASIYKVMGDSVVEITDGDSGTLAWLRTVQDQRAALAESDHNDPDVRWLSDTADNVIVHDWARQTNRPAAERDDGGMTQHYSTPVPDSGDSMYERDSGGLPRFFSEPQQIGATGPGYERDSGSDTPQHYSTPVVDDADPMYERATGGLLANE